MFLSETIFSIPRNGQVHFFARLPQPYCLSNPKQFNPVYSAASRVFLKTAIKAFIKDSANNEVDNFLPV